MKRLKKLTKILNKVTVVINEKVLTVKSISKKVHHCKKLYLKEKKAQF